MLKLVATSVGVQLVLKQVLNAPCAVILVAVQFTIQPMQLPTFYIVAHINIQFSR